MTTITKKSEVAFEAAAKKLGLATDVPDLNMLRPDLALYLTAVYMLVVINEAKKDGKIYDITDHDHIKYEPVHIADKGYTPGSSAGGFRYGDCASGDGGTAVGARLASNSPEECRELAEEHPDLWEIFTLNVK